MGSLPLQDGDGRARASSDHVTPYDRCAWSDEEAERLLASGAQHEELEAYFGPAEYRELVRLARAAQCAKRRRNACRAVIVPGIMGSLLALPRRAPLPSDVLWLDPIDISTGRLSELALPSDLRVEPSGIVLYSYLRLRLHLRAAGHDAVFHPYDWRRGIDELGRELAGRLAEERSARIALVGHSLGGLVCRAALALAGGERIERVILIGTPNAGSFAPLQALRGTYAVVRKIARLDAHHSCETLASEVFMTFPSLYHMLPQPAAPGALDLTDPRAWPQSGPRPRPELLDSARRIGRMLAPADGRFAVIVGVGLETVTQTSRRQGEFVYTVMRRGDGTVPAERARLAGARHYFRAGIAHSDLTRDPLVARAVIDLLSRGDTHRLPSTWRSASRAQARIGDRELTALPAGKVDWARLTPEERRAFLQHLNEPPALELRVRARPRAPGTRRRG
ncbi:MAG: lipase family alpha/beta hydrolase [Steroidobacteraceae bacterium]